MDKDLNLVKILKESPKGTKLYSIMHGEVEFQYIRKQGNYNIVVSDKYGRSHRYTKEGKFNVRDLGECLLYPSKECRDWNNFRVELPEGTPVMVCMDTSDWLLRFYAERCRAYNNGKRCGDTSLWRYIIPVDKFDFTNCSFKEEDNYGTANC